MTIPDHDIDHLLRDQCNALGNYVCPLYVVERKNGVLIGSGVPMRVGSRGVIVTATHVLQEALRHENRVWTIGDGGPFKLTQNWNGFMHRDRGTVDVDLSVIPLPDREWSALTGRYSVSSERDLGDPPTEVDFLAVVGYPYSRNKPTPRTRHAVHPRVTHVASNVLPATSDDQDSGKYESVHFTVAAQPSGGPKLANFPDPRGMSGGGVWNLRVRQTLTGRGSPQLVGIGIEYNRTKRHFICTRISAISELIEHLDP